MTTELIQQTKQIPSEYCGQRVDAVLSQLFPDYSRAQLTKWIKAEQITLDGQAIKAKQKVKGLETVVLNCQLQVETKLEPQQAELNIAYEDDDLLIINKPANWVVHPGAGNPDNTVVNALLFYHPPLNQLPRAGIIHRLDKDTTGLLIVAKNLVSYNALIKMMQAREISRTYLAIVYGDLVEPITIDAPIGRHPTQRVKMAINGKGKPAITHVEPIEFYDGITFIQVKLETGRTHQIRVHLTHNNHPLVGDQTYQNKQLQKQTEKLYDEPMPNFKRQALHAYELTFEHPINQKPIEVTATLPDDMDAYLDWLDEQFDKGYENDDNCEYVSD